MAKNSKRPVIVGSNIAREEYDFSDVPNDELRACELYEYARESEAILQEIKRLKQQIREQVPRKNGKAGDKVKLVTRSTKLTNHIGESFEGMILLSLAAIPKSPESPWQMLSKADRERLKHLPERASKASEHEFQKQCPALVMVMPSKSSDVSELTLSKWTNEQIGSRFPQLEPSACKAILLSGFIQINPLYSHEYLIKSFRAELERIHPTGIQKSKERRGRHSARDRLNALGALRLRFHCRTLTEAQNLIARLGTKENRMSYTERRAFNRACEIAIQHFNSILELPDNHRPIHFTKGWQK